MRWILWCLLYDGRVWILDDLIERREMEKDPELKEVEGGAVHTDGSGDESGGADIHREETKRYA